jgi:hypothetical protein
MIAILTVYQLFGDYSMSNHSKLSKNNYKNSEYKSQISQNNLISSIRSLTRLVIGGLIIGSDRLSHGLGEWELNNDNERTFNSPKTNSISDQEDVTIITSNNDLEQDEFRSALIGLLFRSQDQIISGLDTIDRTTRKIHNLTNPLIKPLYNLGIVGPLKNRFEHLIVRGEEQVKHWIDIGRTEEIRSRKIIENAAVEQVDNAVLYLAENPEIQEIIQGQSVSLANEIVEEIRERAVSADNLIEGVIRTMFRLKSRKELPEPPLIVRQRAIQYRKPNGKIYK